MTAAAARELSLGLMEVTGWAPSLAAIDAAEKAAAIRVLQVELNDLYGACAKLVGAPADLAAALAAGRAAAEGMNAACVTRLIPAPDPASRAAYEARPEFNPLIEQHVVSVPKPMRSSSSSEEPAPMSEQAPFAIGIIETQGLTAVIDAVDAAVKAANVEVLGREKLGGGYVAVVLRGDVAAVSAAVVAGREKIETMGLGKLIATHVIARPSTAVLGLIAKFP